MNVNLIKLQMVKENIGTYDGRRNMNSPEVVYDFLKDYTDMTESPEEQFYMLALNTKHQIVGVHLVSQGSLNSSVVHPREVFKRAMLNNACSIIVAHNHPSGNPAPSQTDIDVTRRLAEGGELLGIKVLDHIITGDGNYISLKEKMLI
ncbi:MAG: DNA repair protein RadC [Eubacteriales bacterium]|nr:DNA repair protein RadC [Eubacteriales bacterium]